MSKLAALVVWTFAFTPSLVAAQSTIRASVDSSGNQGSGTSIDPVTSSDGRFTAFRSTSAFVVTDTNGQDDIYRRDRVTGQTVLVSVSTSGAAGAGLSFLPAITPIGRFVVFVSGAPDLVAGDTNGKYDIFVRDMVTGTTELVSKSTAGVLSNFDSGPAEISNDGRYVAFTSGASNLVAGDTNNQYDVFLRDRTLATTIRVSVDTAGNQSNGPSGTQKRYLQISGNGRYVSFASDATNLVPLDTNGVTTDIYIRDLQLGTTSLASLNSFGAQGNSLSREHALSYDGRYLAFSSLATNMVANDVNGVSDVFVRDLQTGYTALASISSLGAHADAVSGAPSLSLDGRYIGFASAATNLSPLAPALMNVYVRDRATGLTTLESPNQAGSLANDYCVNPSISASGRYVAYQSLASDLVTGDTNGQIDVFLRDRGALPQYVSYCFGDGFGGSCPCANESDYGNQEGCKHALGYGTKLTAEGVADTTADTFVLVGLQLTNSAALYFQGTTDLSGGNGIPFGDGLLCIGGTIIRLGVKFSVLGTSRYPEMSDPPISVGGAVTFGTFRHYQAWYRDAIPFCTMATYNLTNAIQVLWLPCPMCP